MKALGAYHTSELYFVMDSPWPLRGSDALHAFAAEDRAMVEVLQRYWAAMAADGDPNGSGHSGSGNDAAVSYWPEYEPETAQYMQMATPPSPGSALESTTCDFWDDLLGY